jgi:hypothetical protein
VESGSQALAVSPSNGQNFAYRSHLTTETSILITADLLISSSSVQTDWVFATFGITSDRAAGIRVNSSDQILLVGPSVPVGVFTRDEWHRVELLLDYSTTIYDVLLDGMLIGDNVPFAVVGEIAPPMIGVFGEDTGHANSGDIGYMDNYSVEALVETVPEPSLIPLLGYVLCAITRRRARRAIH